MNVSFSVGTTILIYAEAMFTPFTRQKRLLHIQSAILNGYDEATVTEKGVFTDLPIFHCNISEVIIEQVIWVPKL